MRRLQWRKLGLIFSPRNYSIPWMSEFAQAPCALVLADRVRVFFSTRPPADASGGRVSLLGYVDFVVEEDEFRVIDVSESPILPLGGLGDFDEFGTYPVSVIEDNGKFLAYYGGWSRCGSVPFDVSIGAALSDDGRNFHKLGRGPVLTASVDEPFVISGPKVRRFGDTLYLFYIAGRSWEYIDGRAEVDYRIRLATSLDGVNWTKAGVDLVTPLLSDDEAQASPDVIFANGIFHMFFCHRKRARFRGQEGSYKIGYASSRDLVHWVRDDGYSGLSASADGFDSEMVCYPNLFAWHGRYYMLYLGNGFGVDGFGAAVLGGALR
jgi:hypothetical protein